MLTAAGLKLATAESCTGGLISTAMCATENSGEFYTSGFTTFTNSAKQQILGVAQQTLETFTAVSQETVTEMAKGAKQVSAEDIGLSVSGYAGPEGGEDGTPAGTVWFGWYFSDNVKHAEVCHFDGDCEQVITQAAEFALKRLAQLVEEWHLSGALSS